MNLSALTSARGLVLKTSKHKYYVFLSIFFRGLAELIPDRGGPKFLKNIDLCLESEGGD